MEQDSISPRWLAPGMWAGWIQRVWLWAGWIVFGLAAGRFILHFLDPLGAVAFLLTLIAFCFPGWVFLSLLWGGETASHRPELWLWGGALGLAANLWLVMIESYLLGRVVGWSVLGLCLLSLVVWFLYAGWKGRWPLPLRPWSFGERVLWLVISLWIMVFLSRALLPFGVSLPDGSALYNRIFTADIFARIAASTSLALSVPYTPLAMSGAPAPLEQGLSLFPVVGRGWMDPSGPMHSWAILTNFVVAIGFGGILVSVLRAFVNSLRGVVLAAFVVFFAYGFYWILSVLRPDLIGAHSIWTKTAIGPSVYHWMLINPQALLTLALGLFATAWIIRAGRPSSRSAMVGFGFLSGVMTALDYHQGWLALVAGGVWVVLLWLFHPHDRARLSWGVVLFAAGAACAFVPVTVLRIQTPHPVTQLEWIEGWTNTLALPGRVGLFYGPLLILGIWGACRRSRGLHDLYGPVVYWALLTVGCALLSVLRPAGGGVLPGLVLVMGVLIGGIGWVFETGDLGRVGRWVALGVLAVSLPGLAHDYLNAGPPKTPERALAIDAADHRAALWARQFLPVESVVQSGIEYRNYGAHDTLGTSGIAWSAALAQRRMIAGPNALCGGVPDSIRMERRWQVAEMLGASRPDSLHARARRLRVDYIYVGPAEMQRRPLLRARLAGSGDLFETVYTEDSAAIFRVYPR